MNSQNGSGASPGPSRTRLPLPALAADCGALLVLAVITAAFFWRFLTSDSVYFPSGGGDLASFLLPMYTFIARSLRDGVLPLWNPYLYGGAPFAADIQTGLFYPLHLLVFTLVPAVTYRLLENLAVLHVWLAGACMYVCLRGLLPDSHAVKIPPALAGATAFMLSDFFVVHLGNLNMIEAAAWLPLTFVLLHRALTDDRPWLAVAAGGVLAVTYYAGHVQPFLMTVLLLAGYAVLRAAIAASAAWSDRRQVLTAVRRHAALLALMLVVAAGLAAPLALPSLEMASYSVRVDLSYSAAMQYSLAPAQLIGMLVPGFFARDPGQFWGPWDRVEMGYLGVLPLLLALLALAMRREPLVRALGLLSVLALFLAFGGYSVLQGWLHTFVPGFDKLRAPARFTYLLDFGLAALAALGMDALLRPLDHRARLALRSAVKLLVGAFLVAAAVGTPVIYTTLLASQDKDATIFERAGRAANGWAFFLLLAGLSLAWLLSRRRRTAGAGLAGWTGLLLIAVDLISLGSGVDVGTQDPTTGFRHDGAVAFLKQDPGYWRLDTRTDVWDVWQPDLSLVAGIQDVSGIWNPLALADYETYWGNLGSRTSPLYDFLTARYVVGHKNVKLDPAKFTLAYDGDPSVSVYRNAGALPRAQVLYNANVLQRDQILTALRDPGFNPARSVLLEDGQPLAGAVANSPVTITAYGANAMTLEVQPVAAGYLVLSEVWYPGWRARVDGQERPVLRANFAFRAVAVAPGDRQIRLVFEPDTWRWGLTLAALTLAALGMWALRSLTVRQGARPATIAPGSGG